MGIKLFAILNRNFLIFLHSKLSSLIIILGPIFLILIVGAGLSNSGIKDLNANIYVSEKTVFTDAFINNLHARSFITSESYSLEDCINSVKIYDKNLCIELRKSNVEIPKNFYLSSQEIEDSGIGYSVYIYTDFSKQRIVWGIINKVQQSVNDFSNKIRAGGSSILNKKLDGYNNEISLRRKELSTAISLIDEINSKVYIIQSELSGYDSSISDLGNNLDSLEKIIKSNSTLDKPMILALSNLKNSFFLLKNNQDLSGVSSNIAFFEKNCNLLKNELTLVDRELSNLQSDMKDTGGLSLDSVINPIPLTYESISGDISHNLQSFDFFDYLFPTFLSFFIVFVSIIFTTNFIIKERISKSYIRNVLSNTGGFSFLLGNFLTIFLVVMFQSMVIVVLASFFINLSLISNLIQILIIVAISSSLFIVFGLVLGYFFNSQETAIIASICLSLLLIMFSPLITPLEMFPSFLKTLLQYTPLILTEDLLKRLLIFDISIFMNKKMLFVLFFYFLVSFIIAMIFCRINKYKQIS